MVPLTCDTIDASDFTALAEWLAPGPHVTLGPLTLEFEQRWAAWLGRTYAVFVNSGSSANLLMYAAYQHVFRDSPGDVLSAIVPPTGWATTVAPAMQLGYALRMVDVDRRTWSTSPEMLTLALRADVPNVVTIAPVLGVPAHMDEIRSLQAEFGFDLLEDACSSYGATYKGQKIGTFGLMSTQSFFYSHQASTLEGGMICTDHEELYHTLLMMRSHGWGRDLPPDAESQRARRYHRDDFNRLFSFYVPGFNVRSTDLQAFIGLRQLDKLDAMLETRRINYETYQVAFTDSPIRVQQPPSGSTVGSIACGLACPDRNARARVVSALAHAEIACRPLAGGNLGLQPFWTDVYGIQSLPVADWLHDRAMQVPNHIRLTPADAQHVAGVVLGAL